jgi:lysophospholipase L1-like esterase
MGREKRSKFANDAKSTADLASSLAQKATKEEVETKVAQIVTGSPKGTYATLSALQTAFPTGTTGVYVVTTDGKWYYWNSSAWTAGGTYQSTGIADKSILKNNLSVELNNDLYTSEEVQMTNIPAIFTPKMGTPIQIANLGGNGTSAIVTQRCKNLMYYPYHETTKTQNGLTFTDNGDGTITVNGTATAQTTFYFALAQPLKAGSYILNGVPAGGGGSTFFLYLNTTGAITATNTSGDSSVFTLATDQTASIRITIQSGAVLNSVVFKPMVRLSSVSDPTYESGDIKTVLFSTGTATFTAFEGENRIYTKAVTMKTAYQKEIPYSYALSKQIDELNNITTNPTLYKGSDVTVFKKGIAIGDSITQGTFNHNGTGTMQWVTKSEYSWPNQFKKFSGVEIDNHGLGGYTSDEWYASKSSADLSGHDFAVIMLGINDVIKRLAFDTTSVTAMNNIITKLQTENPGIKIFVSTIIPAYTGQYHDAGSVSIRDYVSNRNDPNVYLLDIRAYSDCLYGTPYEAGHLTALGYSKMAQEIAAYISWIISNNLNGFKQVQFIGSTMSYT